MKWVRLNLIKTDTLFCDGLFIAVSPPFDIAGKKSGETQSEKLFHNSCVCVNWERAVDFLARNDIEM